ncbi:UDP-N-acetylmuramoyl-tripeptide--D-alanyl-D-alanine ligase [Patescibacteria group bacterium]|nr:UDP-N-acetylmuramoyl-tripeptide--D-alanyl-D-alanine ligase [Patescibacteria group bacterium]
MQKTIENILGWCVRRAIFRDGPMVVAIAGSVGKTSTRNAITISMGALFKSEEFRTSKKNFNNELGLPISVFDGEMPGRNVLKWFKLFGLAFAYAAGLKKLDMRYLVLEMAADHPGDLDYLLRIAPPKIAIMTAMGAEHVEYFGSLEAAIEEERRVLRALPEDGEAILNTDDGMTWESRDLVRAEAIGFGRAAEAVVRIESTKVIYDENDFYKSGLEVNIKIMNYTNYIIRLHGVFGEPHAYAVAAALAFCESMDHDIKPAVLKLSQDYTCMPGRTRLIKGIKKTILLDDSYNAQPQAMVSAIKDLQNFPVPIGGRRIAALGEMLELGEMAEHEHEKIGKIIAGSGIDFLLCCGTLGRTIAHSAEVGGMPKENIFHFDNSSEAGLFLQQEVISVGDVVLVKGSQGSRMEKIVKELMAEPLRAEELLVRHTKDWISR